MCIDNIFKIINWLKFSFLVFCCLDDDFKRIKLILVVLCCMWTNIACKKILYIYM